MKSFNIHWLPAQGITRSNPNDFTLVPESKFLLQGRLVNYSKTFIHIGESFALCWKIQNAQNSELLTVSEIGQLMGGN